MVVFQSGVLLLILGCATASPSSLHHGLDPHEVHTHVVAAPPSADPTALLTARHHVGDRRVLVIPVCPYVAAADSSACAEISTASYPFGYNYNIIRERHGGNITDFVDQVLSHTFAFIRKSSFGKLRLSAHFMPPVVVPEYNLSERSCGSYPAVPGNRDDSASDLPDGVLSWAVKAAATQGFRVEDYFTYFVITPKCFEWDFEGNRTGIGTTGSLLNPTGNQYNVAVTHELGHMLGSDMDFYQTTLGPLFNLGRRAWATYENQTEGIKIETSYGSISATQIGTYMRGTRVRHPYDPMGNCEQETVWRLENGTYSVNGADVCDYYAYKKAYFGWVDTDQIVTVDCVLSECVYFLQPNDAGTLLPGVPIGLRIPVGPVVEDATPPDDRGTYPSVQATVSFYLEYRQYFVPNMFGTLRPEGTITNYSGQPPRLLVTRASCPRDGYCTQSLGALCKRVASGPWSSHIDDAAACLPGDRITVDASFGLLDTGITCAEDPTASPRCASTDPDDFFRPFEIIVDDVNQTTGLLQVRIRSEPEGLTARHTRAAA